MLEENIRIIRKNIEKASRGREIKLIAVTKNIDIPTIKEAINLGIGAIGETRVQEAEKKQRGIRDVEWHFIGHLQRNKAKKAVEIFDWIHTVDSVKLARKISDASMSLGKSMPVLVQVNIAGKTYGVGPEGLHGFIDEIKNFRNIEVKGLMAIAPLVEPEETRLYFRKMKELAEKANLKELSMGMSNDYEIAIEEGATIVRIGSAIFGKR